MIDDANPTAQHDPLADVGTSGYAGLRRNNRIFPHNDIVGDLNQVVDLATSADDGSP
jgi:hypothetical protein